MNNFDVFLGHSINDAEVRLKELLEVDDLPLINKKAPFSWYHVLKRAFDVIPDSFLPLMEIVYIDSTNQKTFAIDREVIYDACYLDIISTSRFYYKNRKSDELCNYKSIWQQYVELENRKRYIKDFKDTYLYKLFDIVQDENAKYFIPMNFSKVIYGLIISIKNCPIVKTPTLVKFLNFYKDISACENDVDNLHFIERYFSLSLIAKTTSMINRKTDFDFNFFDLYDSCRYITYMPNIIGRASLVEKFIKMKAIKAINVLSDEDCLNYNVNNWASCLSYLSIKISRKSYPIWEALVIVMLSRYFDDIESILTHTYPCKVDTEIRGLFDNINVSTNNFQNELFEKMCAENFRRFGEENQIEKKNEDIVKREVDYINYRSIFFEESMFNNIEPFLPYLSKM